MPEIIQPSFAKGEISPSLYGRVDTSAYALGLATARNAIIHTYGGVSRRPGLGFLGPCKEHSYAPKLVEFQFKTTDTYILEFGDFYMRVIRNDAHVLTGSLAITGATQATPVVVTATAHGFSNGDEVYISGVVGMTELNSNRYVIANVTANTFELTHQVTGANINGTAFGAYSSGGTVGKIYEITTPYAQADLADLDFVQSADVMTFVHKSYPIYELSRLDHDDWTLSEKIIGPTLGVPTDITITVNSAGAETREYTVTAIDGETEEEGLAGLNDIERVITSITQADPGVVTTSAAHGYVTGDEVQLDNVVGMTEVNGERYIVTVLTTTTFELNDLDNQPIDTTGFTAYSSAGIARSAFRKITNSAVTEDNTIAWTAVPGANRYAVYRKENGVFGLIGETTATTFTDENIAPDAGETPPRARNPFNAVGDYPGAIGYHEQRLVLGGSTNKPDTSEFSQVANQDSFNRSRPARADDAITSTLASEQVNEIRHYVSQNDLIVLTSGSEWRITAGPDNILEPDTIQQKPQSTWGSARLPPIQAGTTIIYVTADGANVRTLGYSLEQDGYTGANLNILSQHLLLDHYITSWSYVRVPESKIYMVRDDGVVVVLSYNTEQEVIAWSRWDTDGKFENTAALRGAFGSRDKAYFVVKRTVDGNTVRYIETCEQVNNIEDVRDAFFVDSGLSYNQEIAITGVSATNPVVVTAPSHGLSNGDTVDIFDIVWEPTYDEFYDAQQPSQLNTGRYLVANVTANTLELTSLTGTDIDGTAFNAYVEGGHLHLAVDSVSGLGHLEGRTVAALCDGNVVADLVVTNGAVTLPRKCSHIHIGLRYIVDIETLNIESPEGTIQSYNKHISSVWIRFYQSRGLFVGPNSTDLYEMKQREFENMGDPTTLLTGDKELTLSPSWNSRGRVFMRQVDPLPLTILAIIPSFDVGTE